MRFRLRAAFALLCAVFAAWGVLSAQRPFNEYSGGEYENFELPPDYQQKTEWTRARLKYDQYTYGGGGGFGRGRGGYRRSSWGTDYPRSDRHLLQGVRRLTRINTRSVEQIVELDGSDDIYNWPMLYAVEVGHWSLPDEQAKQLREFIDRGGFFMCDDFHGTREWAVFIESFSKVFPDRQIVEIADSDQIFHTIYDLEKREQVPGWQWYRTGNTYEYDGFEPRWRAIYDDKGRIVAAICHNMDLGDAWEWSDDPRYPEHWASLAYRIAMNYFIYDLTH
jgi:hypothetical protein